MSTFTSALKRLTAAVVATASVVALTACGSGGARDLLADIESGHVVMGTKYDQPNLGERTPDKQFAGLDTDVSRYVVEYIAKKHGWATPEIEWRETPSAQRETLINNGEVNMITATYSINKGRLKAVDFAGPYLVTHQALLVREDSGIKGLNDIAPGTRLCSVSGSTPAQKVKDALPDDGSFWTNEHYGIGLPKGDDKAKAEVNEALNDMHDSGEFQKIVAKNLGDNVDLGEKPKIGDLSFVDKK